MFKELINKKFGTFADLGDGIDEILKSDAVSKITEENKPFRNEISPKEFGLEELAVPHPYYTYKNKSLSCSPRKTPIQRTFNLNSDFHSLTTNEKALIINELVQHLKKYYTHIYQIVEVRHHFIVSGYVDNHITYICYGNKVGF